MAQFLDYDILSGFYIEAEESLLIDWDVVVKKIAC